jgi:predicted phosphodiesterase
MKAAFFSDVHGNSPALRAVLEDIEREGCETVLMLGDLVNGVDPRGCVELLREWGEARGVELVCIKGNAEAYLATPNRHLLAGRAEEWNWDMLGLMEFYESRLSADDLAWLCALPMTLRWQEAYLVHDSPLDRAAVAAQDDPGIRPEHREWFFHGKGVRNDLPEAHWQALGHFMEAENLKQLFSGHTHLPLVRETEQHLICNTGSVGMPLDGDPRAAWVLWTQVGAQAPLVEIRRVAYDLAAQIENIDRTPEYHSFKFPGFCEAYKQSFLTGLHWKAFQQ